MIYLIQDSMIFMVSIDTTARVNGNLQVKVVIEAKVFMFYGTASLKNTHTRKLHSLFSIKINQREDETHLQV